MVNLDKIREFIFNMLQRYGGYTRELIDSAVVNNIKQSCLNLRELQKKFGVVQGLYSSERNERRAYKIYNGAKRYLNVHRKTSRINSVLDFGGGSCDIIHYLGKLVGAKSIHCVDIEQWGAIKWSRRTDVNFTTDMNTIPSGTINMILSSHCLHHISDNELRPIIENFYRILSSDGILILQEHDCPDSKSKEFGNLLDIEHMMYDVVISQIATYEEFTRTFYSNYKSINGWHKMLSKGFKVVYLNIFDNSSNRSYISVYKKNNKI